MGFWDDLSLETWDFWALGLEGFWALGLEGFLEPWVSRLGDFGSWDLGDFGSWDLGLGIFSFYCSLLIQSPPPSSGETERDGSWPHLWSSNYNNDFCNRESRVNVNLCKPGDPAEFDHFPNRVINYLSDDYSITSSSRVPKSKCL